MTYLPFWLPLPLVGFPPWMVLLAQSWTPDLPVLASTPSGSGGCRGRSRRCFNTPSHHRVHHGANEQYLDKQLRRHPDHLGPAVRDASSREGERVRYGLTKNIETFNPVQVAFDEYGALLNDMRAAEGWKTKLEVAVRGPGWSPACVDDLEVAPGEHVEAV